MAETDFGLFGAQAGSIKRGVTAGFDAPNGGGNYVVGFHSAVTTAEAMGFYYSGTNFSPLRDDANNATGCSIRAAMKRGPASNPLGFSVALFACLQAASETAYGYLLGLSNNDPHRILLAKTTPAAGLDPNASATILATSSATFLIDTWHHLKLDVIVNPNGDTVLKCFSNDLGTNPVNGPVWVQVAGMNDVIDDALGITSSSNPLAGGYAGFCFESSESGAYAFVDHFEIDRQK